MAELSNKEKADICVRELYTQKRFPRDYDKEI